MITNAHPAEAGCAFVGALFLCLSGALLEALHATRLVEGAVFARVERVRCARDFYHVLVVLLTLKSRLFSGADGGADKVTLPRGHVLEENCSVISRMGILFHVVGL